MNLKKSTAVRLSTFKSFGKLIINIGCNREEIGRNQVSKLIICDDFPRIPKFFKGEGKGGFDIFHVTRIAGIAHLFGNKVTVIFFWVGHKFII